MLTIGICGASGSGKSTLARSLADAIRGRTLLIAQDCYYLDHPEMSFSERARINYDDPGAFAHDLLYQDLQTLRAGKPIAKKGYDYVAYRRADPRELIYPADALILDGIHAFYDARLRALMDFKLFVQVDADICLLRRMQRDLNERGRQIDGVAEQYLQTVKPMYEKYVRNYAVYADVIVAGGGRNKKIVDVLAHYLNSGMAGPL